MNQTLIKMLRTLPENQKVCWPESVNKMAHAYNCMKHSRAGYSPYFLLFGHELKLSRDIILCTKRETGGASYANYVKDWKQQMEEAYTIVRKNAGDLKGIDKKHWNSRRMLSPLRLGTRF